MYCTVNERGVFKTSKRNAEFFCGTFLDFFFPGFLAHSLVCELKIRLFLLDGWQEQDRSPNCSASVFLFFRFLVLFDRSWYCEVLYVPSTPNLRHIDIFTSLTLKAAWNIYCEKTCCQHYNSQWLLSTLSDLNIPKGELNANCIQIELKRERVKFVFSPKLPREYGHIKLLWTSYIQSLFLMCFFAVQCYGKHKKKNEKCTVGDRMLFIKVIFETQKWFPMRK